MKDGRKILLKYSITVVIAGIVAWSILDLRGFWSVTTLFEKYRALSDAFAVPGVLLVMFSALMWISSEGFFDGLGYAFSRIGGMFIPLYQKAYKHETYLDYKKRKSEKRVGRCSFLLFVGLVFIVVAIVFTVLYNSVL